MNKQITPDAFWDSLSLAYKLDSILDGFKQEEIHLFSYFSSLLYLYAGHPISTWGHKYIVSNGYPFSDSIQEAIKRHIQNGLVSERDEYYAITARGVDEYNKFISLPSFKEREKFLNAACTTSILIPYSQTIRALLAEPEIIKATILQNNSWLEIWSIYPKVKEISEAVGINSEELLIPAVTWINYLTEKGKE